MVMRKGEAEAMAVKGMAMMIMVVSRMVMTVHTRTRCPEP
jgi:hypothetical protein